MVKDIGQLANQLNNRDTESEKKLLSCGAAIAHWIRLRLPSCRPGSSPEHTKLAWLKGQSYIDISIGHTFEAC